MIQHRRSAEDRGLEVLCDVIATYPNVRSMIASNLTHLAVQALEDGDPNVAAWLADTALVLGRRINVNAEQSAQREVDLFRVLPVELEVLV